VKEKFEWTTTVRDVPANYKYYPPLSDETLATMGMHFYSFFTFIFTSPFISPSPPSSPLPLLSSFI
jgi:hypothetical protein